MAASAARFRTRARAGAGWHPAALRGSSRHARPCRRATATASGARAGCWPGTAPLGFRRLGAARARCQQRPTASRAAPARRPAACERRPRAPGLCPRPGPRRRPPRTLVTAGRMWCRGRTTRSWGSREPRGSAISLKIRSGFASPRLCWLGRRRARRRCAGLEQLHPAVGVMGAGLPRCCPGFQPRLRWTARTASAPCPFRGPEAGCAGPPATQARRGAPALRQWTGPERPSHP